MVKNSDKILNFWDALQRLGLFPATKIQKGEFAREAGAGLAPESQWRMASFQTHNCRGVSSNFGGHLLYFVVFYFVDSAIFVVFL
jgi:hypothetical protein